MQGKEQVLGSGEARTVTIIRRLTCIVLAVNPVEAPMYKPEPAGCDVRANKREGDFGERGRGGRQEGETEGGGDGGRGRRREGETDGCPSLKYDTYHTYLQALAGTAATS